jgi:winged helix DNA-binding protein
VPDRVLSTRQLNRALLARQLLLERAALAIPRALERLGGLQTQYAPSAYVGLWSRLEGFERADLTSGLERRRVVQATMMRVTIHMASPPDYRAFTEGVRRSRREWWLAATRRQMDGTGMQAVARSLRRRLASGPARADELKGNLADAGFPPMGWQGAGLWLDLVRVPPSGTWERRKADLYGLAEDWVPGPRVTEAEGLERLVRAYLGGFGPASVRDIANWAGVPNALVGSVVERLRLRRFRDESGGELLDLPRAPLPDPDTPAPVRFLPTWDATLLVHARRTAILPEALRSRVFSTKTPHSVPTFLVDGAVAGSWRVAKGRITLDPFAPLSRSTRRELDAEAERLAAFHAD